METEADFPLFSEWVVLMVRWKKARIVESRRTFLKAWWSFELSSDVVGGWWVSSDDEEHEGSVSVWIFWSLW